MPDPGITPTTLGQTEYQVVNSKGLVADLSLALDAAQAREVSVTHPPAAPGLTVTLRRGTTPLVLTPGLNDTTTFSGRTVNVTGGVGPGGTNVLACIISVSGSPPATPEAWSVTVTSAAANAYAVSTDGAFTRVMCDPLAGFTIPAFPGMAAGHVPETQPVTLVARDPVVSGANRTVVGLPAPVATYRWTKSGGVAIPAFPACGTSQTIAFTSPGVYGNRPLDAAVEVWFDSPCPTPGPLNNQAPAQTVTVEPRPQRMVLVLDRSGSMLGARWANAKTAARILTHLFVALRGGNVHPEDRIGILVFEDATCNWHAAPTDALIAPVLSMSDTAAANSAICPLPFGNEGSCTPIGDALIEGADMLRSGASANARLTMILLTDGYENSGTARIDPNTPDWGGFRPLQYAQPTDITLFAIGLGEFVQEDVLDRLALPPGASAKAFYRKITDVGRLKEAISDMVSFSQEAQPIVPLTGAPSTGDPSPPAQARYFATESGVDRLAIVVEWTDSRGDLELAHRSVGPGAFTALDLPVERCETHGFVTVDVAALGTGPFEWRIEHRENGASQAIPNDDLLIYVDLFAKAEIAFDRDRYRTGDAMVITARLRAGDQPIDKARVFVELARPGESLGTFLAVNGGSYQPPPLPPGPDPPSHPKHQMFEELLRRKDRTGLGVVEPRGIFRDGTNELWDDGSHQDGTAGDGDFANTFSETVVEGTYTFRFFIQGELPDGSPFTRLLTISRWLGVAADPLLSAVELNTRLPSPGAGLAAATVMVTPQDALGNYLGPFRAAEVGISSSIGTFVDNVQSNYDGSYSRTLHYPKGSAPVISVSIGGRCGLPIVLGAGCLPAIVRWLLILARKLLDLGRLLSRRRR